MTTLRRHSEFGPKHRVGLQCVLLAALAVGAIAVRPAVADEPGRVRGVVRFEGVVPKAKTADEAGRKQDLFAVHPQTCGLRGAVVYWIDAPAEPLPDDAGELPVIVVDQNDFTFVPQVVSVRSGQPVKFTNSDSANHNVRTAAFEPKNQFNVFTGTGYEYVHRFVVDKKQRPTRLGSDIHAWMGAGSTPSTNRTMR